MPRSWNGEPRKRLACSRSPATTRPRMWVEETISPSTSTSGTTRGSNAVCARSRSASPLALWPKRKFSPTDTVVAPSFATRMSSMNSCGPWAANERSNGITTSSRTPRPAIRSVLISSEVRSFGAASGATTWRGCGSKVSTVSAPRITSRWPRWTPSNSPTATWRGRVSTSGSQVTRIRWWIPRPPCPDVRGPWMQGGARRRGTVAEPRTPFGGGRPAPRDACRRGWGARDQPSVRLRGRAGEDLVDVDVRRLPDGEHHRAGDVVGLQRVDLRRAVEERRVGHAGLDQRDADAGVVEVLASALGHAGDRPLGRGVERALERAAAGHGAGEEQVA